jgi:hypothetical protein
MLLIAERRFRRLNAPELLQEVYLGMKFAMDCPSKKREWGSPPDPFLHTY